LHDILSCRPAAAGGRQARRPRPRRPHPRAAGAKARRPEGKEEAGLTPTGQSGLLHRLRGRGTTRSVVEGATTPTKASHRPRSWLQTWNADRRRPSSQPPPPPPPFGGPLPRLRGGGTPTATPFHRMLSPRL